MNKDKTKEKRAGFTQGEWIVELEQKEQLAIYPSEGRYPCMQPIAICHARDINERAKNEAQANAHLIASAPAMYEVLTELLDTLELSKGYGWDEEYENVREVLAKADGRAEG